MRNACTHGQAFVLRWFPLMFISSVQEDNRVTDTQIGKDAEFSSVSTSEMPSHLLFFFLCMTLFISLWLCCLHLPSRLSWLRPAGSTLRWGMGFSLPWLLWLHSTGSRRTGHPPSYAGLLCWPENILLPHRRLQSLTLWIYFSVFPLTCIYIPTLLLLEDSKLFS